MGGSDLGWPRHNLKTLFKNNESKKGWGCQVAECLPSKRKALSSNPSTTPLPKETVLSKGTINFVFLGLLYCLMLKEIYEMGAKYIRACVSKCSKHSLPLPYIEVL
jgi:hypothetical protein